MFVFFHEGKWQKAGKEKVGGRPDGMKVFNGRHSKVPYKNADEI